MAKSIKADCYGLMRKTKSSSSESINDLVCERREGKMQIATGNDRVEQQDILRRNETERVGPAGGCKG